MATEAQAAANARNARKSSGPKTTEGKAKSSQNALKHGLRSEAPVMRTIENEDDWQAHLQNYIEDAKPVGDVEFKLAEQAAMCQWKQARAELLINLTHDAFVVQDASSLIAIPDSERPPCERARRAKIEALISEWMNDGGSLDDAERGRFLRELGLSVNIGSKSIESLERYFKTFENGFYRAYKELEKRRIERKKDAERQEDRAYERWKTSLRVPDEPSLAVVLEEYRALDDVDIEFLCEDATLGGVRKKAAIQVRDDRKRVIAMAKNRANKLAEAAAGGLRETIDPKQAGPLATPIESKTFPTSIVDSPFQNATADAISDDQPPRASDHLGSFGNGAQNPYLEKTYLERRGAALASLSPGVRQILEEHFAELDREIADC
jgi:hypothetical protein